MPPKILALPEVVPAPELWQLEHMIPKMVPPPALYMPLFTCEVNVAKVPGFETPLTILPLTLIRLTAPMPPAVLLLVLLHRLAFVLTPLWLTVDPYCASL